MQTISLILLQTTTSNISGTVIFGVLTTDSEEQALARIDGKRCHKGRDAVDAAMEMISVLEQIEAE